MKTERKQAEVIDQLQAKMQALSTRDLQLWSIGLLVLVVLAAGVVALLVPNMVWSTSTVSVAGRYLPQLFFGLIALIILFNIYVLSQRRELNAARQELVSQLMFNERTENLSLVDPLTQVFNRRYLDHIVPKEITQANRHGSPLSFVLVDIDDFKAINARFGHLAGDQALIEVARLLRQAVSASETVLRYGGDEFLLILPDHDEAQAAELSQRLLTELACWNQSAQSEYQLALSCGVAAYAAGADVRDVLRTVEQNVAGRKRAGAPARRLPADHAQALVVCDDTDANQVLRFVLESNDVEMELCRSTADAMGRLARRKLDAVIVDCDMLGGAELAANVRSLPTGKHMIVITVGAAATVHRAGANFVLEKPLSAALTARSLRVAHAMMIAERARYFRQPVEMVVAFALVGGEVRNGTATDISDGGMALRCPTPIAAGAKGRLQFILPGSANVLHAQAEVAWSDGEGRAGLRFLDIPRAARTELQQWLAAKKAERKLEQPAAGDGKKAAAAVA